MISIFIYIYQVKLWKLDSKAVYISNAQHEKEFSGPVECVAFNPFVKSSLSVSAGSSLISYDIESQQVVTGM